MPYTLGPNGEVLYDGQVIAGAGQSLSGYGFNQPQPKGPPPEIPGGNLATAQGPGTTGFNQYYGSGATDSSGSSQQQQQRPQQPQQRNPSMTSARDYANWANQQGMGGSRGAVYDAQGNVVNSTGNLAATAAAGQGSTMGAGGVIRDPSGMVYDSEASLSAQDVGGAGATMPGAGGGAAAGGAGGMLSGIGSAIGSIGSAIGQGIANSVGSWKMQPSHIPTSVPQYQTPQFQRKMIV